MHGQEVDYELLELRTKTGKNDTQLEIIEELDAEDKFIDNLSPANAENLRKILEQKHKVAVENMNSYCTKFFSEQYLSKEKNSSIELTEKIKNLREELRGLKSNLDSLKLE